ncbi:MAG: putative Zn-dependent peptidase [Myxococcales bacterium]|nr:putative Zn-dependent peptidase [Myxococcales bacterium]
MIRTLLLATTLLAAIACGGKTPATVPAPPPQPVADLAPTKPLPPETKPMPPPVPTQTATAQDLAFPDEEFRAHQPAAAAPRAFKLPAVKPFTLKNGIKVYLVEQHTLPIVSMDLNFDGGSIVDPKGKEGLASICMAMLTEGTEKLDKIGYSEALADVASSISAYAGDDSQGIGLSSLTKHLDATFALFADTVRTPGLRDSDFDRMVKRRIESVKQSRGTPSSIPGRVLNAILYGHDHPLGAITTEESLKAITLADCKQHIATWLHPKNARLFVVGDLNEAQVRKTFESSPLAAWTGAVPDEPRMPAPKTLAGRIFFVNVPKAAQSTVMVLQFGPKRTAPEYFANSMMSAVFGGSFTSRLNMNLREDKGYSYGSRGGFGYSKAYGTLSVNAPVQADSTYQTILEIDRELKDLWSGQRPVTKEELEREKTNAILALPGRFGTAGAALGQYRSLVYYGLRLDYFNTYVDKVSKVTDVQVKQSAAKNLRPGQAVYLVVGDGDAKMIVHNASAAKDAAADVRRLPYQKDGKQLTLREALTDLAKRGDVGAGGLVELDVDGKQIH